jgi:hypothetical protein
MISSPCSGIQTLGGVGEALAIHRRQKQNRYQQFQPENI